jgi:hypothetical protein
MKVLKATEEQYTQLNNYKNDCNAIEFVKDANDRWIINTDVLTDDKFIEIREALNKLEEIDYIAPLVIDEEPLVTDEE